MSQSRFSTTVLLDKTTSINLRHATTRVRRDGTRCGAFVRLFTDLRLTLSETVDATTLENCGRKATLFAYLERCDDTLAQEFQIYCKSAVDRLFAAAHAQDVEAAMEVLSDYETQSSMDSDGTNGGEHLLEAFSDGCKSYANQLRMDADKATARKSKASARAASAQDNANENTECTCGDTRGKGKDAEGCCYDCGGYAS